MTFIANSELCGLRVFAGHIPKFGCGASRAVLFVSFVVKTIFSSSVAAMPR
jgi:hypothetical protein